MFMLEIIFELTHTHKITNSHNFNDSLWEKKLTSQNQKQDNKDTKHNKDNKI